MLERYFSKPDTIDRIRSSWIGDPIEWYVTWLHENGYSARQIPRRVSVLRQFGEFARSQGAMQWGELPNHVAPFVTMWVQKQGPHCTTEQARRHLVNRVRSPVQQLLELILPHYSGRRPMRRAKPFATRVPGFWDYLSQERGLPDATITLYVHTLGRFERYLSRIALDDLSALSPAVLTTFITQSGRELGKLSIRVQCSHLRIFVGYLYRERQLDRDLRLAIEAPPTYRLAALPRAISWNEVQRLLEVVDRRTPIGRRDYAILLLLTTYGLRAREVAALTLDDIDWKRERFRVPQRKAGHSTAYPLSPGVGEALVAYLRQGRPETSERAVFFQTKAPYHPIKPIAISQRSKFYLHKAGIEVPRPGSHTLRHTCVQRLVDTDFDLKTIGDYVGHRSPSSTMIYTKVAVEALREVALGDGEELL